MIDVEPTNVKLQLRARRILRDICGDRCPQSDEELGAVLKQSERSVKVAAMTISCGVSVEEAKLRLREAGGVLANVLNAPQTLQSGVPGGGTKEAQYVLCVDGGGSKCKAVIISDAGVEGAGEAGPCNPSDIGVEAAIAAIDLAIQKAVESGAATQGRSINSLQMAEVWIGVAGLDRKNIGTRMRLEVTKLLGEQPAMITSVTNDIELLAMVAGQHTGVKDVIVLIAGTGSVVMRYRWDGAKFSQVARRGGWGALLGDDGSGFDIGRRAIRAALVKLETHYSQVDTNWNPNDPLQELILNYYRHGDGEANNFDLLSSVLLSDSDEPQHASETKQRIASCAEVVVDAIDTSDAAHEIVISALDSLLHLTRSIASDSGLDKHESALVLAGGLMQSEMVRRRLKDRIVNAGMGFRHVEHIGQPASAGARFLAQVAFQSCKKV